MATVKPGLWRHYDGGLYTVLGIVTHHETREPMVLYISHTYGGVNVRPVNGWRESRASSCQDPDGWLDQVLWHGKDVPRFQYVGALPSDVPLKERIKG